MRYIQNRKWTSVFVQYPAAESFVVTSDIVCKNRSYPRRSIEDDIFVFPIHALTGVSSAT